ncbi:SRPBCC family protein [Sphingosinicella terrae]|jgi:uncharacterized protein YndB with AHSA1/START domain|uniref:SRPBCC family protein n=1 Tax=Sphingosinicella terrae TaxID=2172047 RepID=UPI000E0D9ACC|nr:SRPBCC family protein [Sphingosinicella terrae]
MANDHQDLVIERTLDAPRDLVWKAWTDPEHLKRWWAPRPYETVECEMDLRPGGRFHTRMKGPDDFDEPGTGCFLEIVPGERIVWTSALGPGFRPSQPDNCGGLPFTAIVTMEDAGGGRTLYRAVAMHGSRADRDRHAELGFEEGWGTVTGQLGEVARALGETV